MADVASGPAYAIDLCGRPLAEIATLAGLDVKTVSKARRMNHWPAQRRTRKALAAALAAIAMRVSPHG